jgi:hypothetical protein
MGSIFLTLLVIDFVIYISLPSKINYDQIPHNTSKAITGALIAFVIFFVVTLGVTAFLQSSAFFQGTIDNNAPIQSIMRHGFAMTGLTQEQPIFANSILLTYIQYGIIIAVLETRYLVRLFEAITTIASISIDRFSVKLGAVYIFIAGAFVWFHANVKGIEDNTALIMTFIFALITLELARRYREMEAATTLHILNNVVYIFNRIGF